MFCPKCGSILRPKMKAGKKVLFCTCGFNKAPEEETIELKEKGSVSKKVEIMEDTDTHPKIKAKCEKCGHGIALYWTQQTRGADEPETRFFRCTKCGFTWREYA
ncbi:transcription factor S [Candidatus Woesearchaeota archaeon]|jgi:transcription factor S|nr:transcription factor S [Candidatus Woesearchaeota archaeon]MBT4111193.1 transcription factor S [Candidatus Woesearchaeota archaeon]MBT4336773.1 transcription factor S [Candidatus Woesearchaeota archaeon]MBT4469441.1 transcription factor S [Candidatus Woesearchaeota archaeon]MBT6744164.1 transcription factor S [Candidatus Woesearchaeota archaeon]